MWKMGGHVIFDAWVEDGQHFYVVGGVEDEMCGRWGDTIYLKRGWNMSIDYYVFGGVADTKCGRWGDTIYLKRGWKMGTTTFFGCVWKMKCVEDWEHFIFDAWVEDDHGLLCFGRCGR